MRKEESIRKEGDRGGRRVTRMKKKALRGTERGDVEEEHMRREVDGISEKQRGEQEK